MIRDEKIHEAAFYKGENLRRHGYTEIYTDAFTDGFYEGISWADSSPNWHLCKDEMPEPNVKVLCYTSKGTYFVAWMEEQLIGHNQPTGEYRWSRWNTPIIAWTELPEPPKFD